MSADELDEAKYEWLKEQLQKAVLRDYPNPERKGCPELSVLRAFAERRLTSTIDDDDVYWKHVTHCSECYQDFLNLNNAYRERTRKRQSSRLWFAGALASLFAFALLVYLWRGVVIPARNRNAAIAYAQLDIPSLTRSAESTDLKALYLQRRPYRLAVQLPVGSEAGRYEVILQAQDLLVLSSEANAEARHGITAITVSLNFSKVHPGEYTISVRHPPFDWHYPVVVR